MMKSNGMVKLADFGLTIKFSKEHTRTFSHDGSLPYMAPEIFQEKGYSYPADIWALGVLLYRLCSLEFPFWPKNSNMAAASLNFGRLIIAGRYKEIPAHFSQKM